MMSEHLKDKKIEVTCACNNTRELLIVLYDIKNEIKEINEQIKIHRIMRR